MMNFGAIRAWLKHHQEPYMITERTHIALMDEKEIEVMEFRLTMPHGDMDYTATVLIPLEQVKADRAAAEAKAYDRLIWEAQRDTRTAIDCARACENGRSYQAGQ